MKKTKLEGRSDQSDDHHFLFRYVFESLPVCMQIADAAVGTIQEVTLARLSLAIFKCGEHLR